MGPDSFNNVTDKLLTNYTCYFYDFNSDKMFIVIFITLF